MGVQVDFKKVSKVWAFGAAPAGILLIVLGIRQHHPSAGVWGGILLVTAIPPVFEVVLVVLTAIVAVPVILTSSAVEVAIRTRRQRKALRELDRLAQEGAALEAFQPAVDRLWRPEIPLIPPIQERFRDPRCPYRALLIGMASVAAIDEVALRADDPLGPVSWHFGLARRYNENHMHAGILIRVKNSVPESELAPLWTRALGSADPWALPPELEVHEEHP